MKNKLTLADRNERYFFHSVGAILLCFFLCTFCFLEGALGIESKARLLFESDSGDGKIGHADIATIFNEYERKKEANASLRAEGQKKKKQREEKVYEIQLLQSTPDNAHLLDEKINALVEFDRETKEFLQEARAKITEAILDDIDATMEKMAGDRGYGKIYNSLVHQEGEDLTAAILKDLNSSYSEEIGPH